MTPKRRTNRPRRVDPKRRAEAVAALLPPKTAENDYARAVRVVLRGLHQLVMGRVHAEGLARQDAFTPPDLDDVVEVWLTQVPAKLDPATHRMVSRVVNRKGDPTRKLLGVRYSEAGVDVQVLQAREQSILLVEKAGRAYTDDVREVFSDPLSYTMRPEELSKILQAKADVTESRANLISRDQTLKLAGNVTAVRQQNAGVTEYTWSTSLDERVRGGHQELEGTRQSWLVAPVVDEKSGRRAHPGQDFQCRCVALPVIPELDD